MVLERLLHDVICLTSCILPYRATGADPTTDGEFYLFEGNRYNKKGFLFKAFPMNAIVKILLLWLVQRLHIPALACGRRQANPVRTREVPRRRRRFAI